MQLTISLYAKVVEVEEKAKLSIINKDGQDHAQVSDGAPSTVGEKSRMCAGTTGGLAGSKAVQ